MTQRDRLETDHYDVLDVSPDASADEIRQAFWDRSEQLAAARDSDPAAPARFEALRRAYEVLGDVGARAQYDRDRGERIAPTGPVESVEPVEPAAAPKAPRRHRRWPWVLGALGVALGLGIGAGFVVHPAERIIRPGSATPVEDVVRVKGTKSYPPDGDLLFLTVTISDARPNFWESMLAELDDDVAVVDEREVLGDQTQEEERQASQLEMEQSQLAAQYVALDYLGYDVTRSGTGAIVVALVPDSPAQDVLEVGDVIAAVDGTEVELADEVGKLVQAEPPGSEVSLAYTRDGEERSATVETAERDGKAFLGVQLATQGLEIDFPVEVDIETGLIRGPSAGLAFSLAIIDELTPGELTGGNKIAVTGTVGFDGTVGLIGSARQKAVAAREAGATLMLVPQGEEKDAQAGAGDRMEVVGVANLEEALNALAAAGGEDVPPGVATSTTAG